MTDPMEPSTLALDVMQAALSLTVKRMQEGAEAVTDVEIERAAELFDVGPEHADQIMLVYEMLVAFGDSIGKHCKIGDGQG